MTTMTAHRPVADFSIAVHAQMRVLLLSGRVAFMSALILLGLAATAGVTMYFGLDAELLMLQMTPAVLAAGALWGLIIWRDEPPRQRHYHWSMPVDMAVHDIARVTAGAFWLLIVLTAYFILGTLIALVSNDAVALGRAAPLMIPGTALGALTVYVLFAAVSTAVNRSSEWLLFGYLLLALTGGLMEWLGQASFIGRAVELLFGRPWGVAYITIVPWRGAEARVHNPEQAAVSLYMTEWLPFALLWLVIAAGIVTAVAIRRRGRAT